MTFTVGEARATISTPDLSDDAHALDALVGDGLVIRARPAGAGATRPGATQRRGSGAERAKARSRYGAAYICYSAAGSNHAARDVEPDALLGTVRDRALTPERNHKIEPPEKVVVMITIGAAPE
jgi:hypothetical protein